MKIDWNQVILNVYTQAWFIWLGFFVLGFLLFKFSEHISVNTRDNRKKESAGAGLMAISIVIHLLAGIALIKSI